MDNLEKIKKYMMDWAEDYFRSKDAFQKRIIDIHKIDNVLHITYKDDEEDVYAVPDLKDIGNLLKKGISVITLNNRKNVDYLYYNWRNLSSIPSLRVYFINPFSSLEKKWVISPQIHARICDEASLRAGLLSIFETVEPLTIEIFQTRV